MMRSINRGAAYAALVCALAAVALLVFGRGSDRRIVTAEFTDVRGLVAGAQVRLAGVPVGDVQRIWLGPDGRPRVRLSIDSDVSATRAGVRLASLSGEFNRYVSVVQGPRTSFIPLSRTTSPVEVDDALRTFDPSTRAALTQILAGLDRTLSAQGPAIAATLRQSQAALSQVAGLAGDVGDDGAALRLALRSAHTIASTLASHSPRLADAVDSTTRLLDTIAARAGELATGLNTLPPGLDAAQHTLTGAQALIGPADRLLETARPAVAQLSGALTEGRTSLVAARPVLQRATSLATSTPSAARALLPTLAAARPLLNVMIPVMRRIGPMLDQLRVRLPDAFSFFANWADFTANYDANGHAARVGIVLPPAPTNVLDPSANGPGQLQPPYLRTPGSLEGQPWIDYWKSFVAGGKR